MSLKLIWNLGSLKVVVVVDVVSVVVATVVVVSCAKLSSSTLRVVVDSCDSCGMFSVLDSIVVGGIVVVDFPLSTVVLNDVKAIVVELDSIFSRCETFSSIFSSAVDDFLSSSLNPSDD